MHRWQSKRVHLEPYSSSNLVIPWICNISFLHAVLITDFLKQKTHAHF